MKIRVTVSQKTLPGRSPVCIRIYIRVRIRVRIPCRGGGSSSPDTTTTARRGGLGLLLSGEEVFYRSLLRHISVRYGPYTGPYSEGAW